MWMNYFYNQRKKKNAEMIQRKMRGKVSQREEDIFSLIGSANKGGNVVTTNGLNVCVE